MIIVQNILYIENLSFGGKVLGGIIKRGDNRNDERCSGVW